MADDLTLRGKIAAIVESADDPDAVKVEALRRVETAIDEAWKPGDPPPDRSLAGRWRRAIAARPEAVLNALQRRHPPAEVKLYGNNHEALFTLPDGGGKVLIKFIPGHG